MSRLQNQRPAEHAERTYPVLLALCAFLLGITKVFEPDTLWHITMGREILKTHSLPVTVPFTYTGEGVAWLATEWFSEVLFFLLNFLGGLSAIIILQAVVLGLCSFLLYKALKGFTGSPLISFFVSLFWTLVIRGSFVERPHIFSILCMCVYLLILSRPLTPRSVLAFPLVMILWANLHGGFLIGIVLLGCVLLEEAGKPKKFFPLLTAFLLACCATFCTPYHIHLVPFVLSHAWQARTMDITMEFRSVSSPSFSFVLLAAFLFLSFYLRPTTRWIVTGAVFGSAAILSVRLLPFLYTAVSPLVGEIAPIFAAVIPRRIRTQADRAPLLSLLLPAFAALTLVSWSLSGNSLQRFGLGLEPVFYPEGAMKFIAQKGIAGRAYNTMNFSGALIYHWYPEKKVFQGSFFSEKEIQAREGMTFTEVVRKYSVTHAILETRLKYLDAGLFSRREWALVYWDDTAIVMARRLPENERVIKDNEFYLVDPETLPLQLEKNSIPVSARAEMERETREVPQCALAHLALATIYRTTKKYRDAEGEYLKVLELPQGWSFVEGYAQKNPYHLLALTHLGMMYSQLGRYREAEDILDAAVGLGPPYQEVYYNLGVLYIGEGKLNKAEKFLKKVLKIDPHHSWAWNNLGVIRMRRGDALGAHEAFLRAVTSDPYNQEARKNLEQMSPASR